MDHVGETVEELSNEPPDTLLPHATTAEIRNITQNRPKKSNDIQKNGKQNRLQSPLWGGGGKNTQGVNTNNRDRSSDSRHHCRITYKKNKDSLIRRNNMAKPISARCPTSSTEALF
ncbi:hypothetical protein Zmor_017555 [Zophobas morio]|uniref:Uncharacterized protein n=1 Tax=Zophobas morio TaxID=2755281 RepID=A0AA38I980_9CUCU|nr:hypothetical protein Zmor_017555 [Zophobas morio]